MEPTNSLLNVFGLYHGQAMRHSLKSVSSQGFHICADALKSERLVRTSPLLRASESEALVSTYYDWQSKIRDPSMHYRQEKQRRPEGNKVAWREAVHHVNVPALERQISRMLYSKTISNVYTDARWIKSRSRSSSLGPKNIMSASEFNVSSSSATPPIKVSSPKPLKGSKKLAGVAECISEETGLHNKQKHLKITDEERNELKQHSNFTDKPVLKDGNTSEDRNWKPRSSNWRKKYVEGKNEPASSGIQPVEAVVDIVTKASDKGCNNNTPSEPVHIPSFEKKIDQQLEKISQSSKGSTPSNYVDLSSLNSRMSEETKTSKSPPESIKQTKLESKLSLKDQLDKGHFVNKRNEESFNRNKSSETESMRNEVSNRIRTLSLPSKHVGDSAVPLKKISELPTTSALTIMGGKENDFMKTDKSNCEKSYAEISLELRARRRQQLAEFVSMWSEQREKLEVMKGELLKADTERYRTYKLMAKRRSIREIYHDFFPRGGGEWQSKCLPKQPAAGRLELLGKINDTKRREQLMRSVFGDGPQRLVPTATVPSPSQRRSLQKIRSNFNVNQSREFSVNQESRADSDIKGSLKYILDFKSRLLEN